MDQLDTARQWLAGFDEPDVDPDPDPDRDGLPTAVELSGVTTQAGDTYVSDPGVADTDGDGLTDGEEAGALITVGATSQAYSGISDPGMTDTDGDGVGDGDEYFVGTDLRSGDTDDDGLPDADELDFGSDPLVNNPDDDDYSDEEERERGSAPMAFDESGWRAGFSAALAVLKFGLSAAAKHAGGAKLKAAAKVIAVAKAADVAAPVIWNALRSWDWSDVSMDELRDEVFENDMDEIGETLEGGRSDYVAYVGRSPDGAPAFVGITDDFDQLMANHGGLNVLSVVGGTEPMPLGQARAVAESVIAGAYDRMDGSDLANTRHVIDPANNLHAPAISWGSEQLQRTEFQW